MKILVVDGNSILNRAFYGIRQLTTRAGFPTNAIVGFLKILLKLREEILPDAVAIAFDVKQPTFRHEMYKDYKAHRKGMPEELALQLPVAKELLAALGHRLVEAPGFEADDILGAFAKSAEKNGDECVLATGDRDSLQLVSKNVSVRLATTKFGRPHAQLFDEAAVREAYGVSPAQLIDIKALAGDASDNIPGVAGIGPKGATELVSRFGSVEAIYGALGTVEISPNLSKKLENSRENAFLSKQLGTIVTDVPVDTNFAAYVPGEVDAMAASKILQELEMFAMMKQLGISAPVQETSSKKFTVKSAKNVAEFQRFLKDFKCEGFLVEGAENKLFKIGVVCENSACELNVADENLLQVQVLLEGTYFENFATHDLKTAFHLGFQAKKVTFDTQLAGYLLDPSAKGYLLEHLAETHSVAVPSVQAESENDEFARKLAALAVVHGPLLEKISQNGMSSLLENIEIPLARVLAKMEMTGFAVDESGIYAFGEELGSKIETLEKEIHEYLEEGVNLNSPKQLGTALFEDLGLPRAKKTKTGYSTNADVLEGLRGFHPVVELILQYRELAKLKATYCAGLLKAVGEDGRIHSRFNQTETRTGRISSLEPNLQNIPVRTSLGANLRRFFIAKPGFSLVAADYSQIELRVLAHISRDETMTNAFKSGADIHTATAAQVFNLPENMVTSQLRTRAKAVNFGIIYGIGAFSLARDIGVSRKEAQNYIDGYLERFSGVREYMQRSVEEAKAKGFAETLYGRRRALPELSSSNFNMRSFGERVALNMPIQGTAADIIKIAMINVTKRLKRENLQAQLILQIHDELIVEAEKNVISEVKKTLREEMEGAAQLLVPLTVDVHSGANWLEAKGG